MQEIMLKLKDQTKSCEDKCLDMKNLTFVCEKGEMRLQSTEPFTRYYFKRDPKNPRDPKITHAVRQYCKIIGVPFSFFQKNPEEMKNRMVITWLNSLKSEKATVLAKLRRAGTDYIIRALLPVEYSNISNVEVMDQISAVVGEDFRVEFVIGDERDDLILHIRFISKNTFEISGEKCSYGFSVVMSELGASPLLVDTFLYKEELGTALLASYGAEPFFSCDYDQIQPNDLKSLFPGLIERLKEQLPQIREVVQTAKETDADHKEDITPILKDLRLQRGLSDKFHTRLGQEVLEDEDVRNKWDVANKMSIIAKDFDVSKRMKIEKAAGNLIGLNFAKA